MKNRSKNNKLSIAATFVIVAVLFLLMSCSQKEIGNVGPIVDRATMPKLHATGVSTIISDSGITKYRISAPQWDVYDKAVQPYWEFPAGIHVEKFNDSMKVVADIHGRYAIYYENKQLWELKGKVKMTNIKGELFETERLFWNEKTEKIYSDTLVRITRATGIIDATGFQANQQLTKYHFTDTKAILPFEEKK